jgi:hypothetical protein
MTALFAMTDIECASFVRVDAVRLSLSHSHHHLSVISHVWLVYMSYVTHQDTTCQVSQGQALLSLW